MSAIRPDIPFPSGTTTAWPLLVLLALAACRPGAPAGPDSRDAFGDPYRLVPGIHSAAPDTYPALVGDTLVALVTYPGGCDDHAFSLKVDATPDTTLLWLVHDANGDACEAMVQDELRLPLPSDVRRAPVVALLDPNEPVPHILRWGIGED